jgi:CHAD domain-containing protein
MVALRVSRRSFERRYRDRAKTLLKLARNLPDRPSPSDVHELRVTARRIQVMLRLLPREIRGSQESRRFGLALKSVLRATSQLRDSDTLMDTLEAHKGGLPPEILVKLENQRSDMAARAKVATNLIAEAPAPDVDSLEIRGKKFSRRLRRRVRKQGRSAVGLLPTVLVDESKVAELHSLRKEIKKLRYLLELADKSPPELPITTKWQESLGAIHDLDVAASYLRGQADQPAERTVRELMRIRHLHYLKFINEYMTDSMGTLAGSNILAGGLIPLSS